MDGGFYYCLDLSICLGVTKRVFFFKFFFFGRVWIWHSKWIELGWVSV